MKLTTDNSLMKVQLLDGRLLSIFSCFLLLYLYYSDSYWVTAQFKHILNQTHLIQTHLIQTHLIQTHTQFKHTLNSNTHLIQTHT